MHVSASAAAATRGTRSCHLLIAAGVHAQFIAWSTRAAPGKKKSAAAGDEKGGNESSQNVNGVGNGGAVAIVDSDPVDVADRATGAKGALAFDSIQDIPDAPASEISGERQPGGTSPKAAPMLDPPPDATDDAVVKPAKPAGLLSAVLSGGSAPKPAPRTQEEKATADSVARVHATKQALRMLHMSKTGANIFLDYHVRRWVGT